MTDAESFLRRHGFDVRRPWLDCCDSFVCPRSHLEELALRKRYIQRYGFAILDTPTVRRLRSYAPLVEVGSGSGYWAYECRRAGVDVVATDPGTGRYRTVHWSPYGRVETLTGVEAVERYPDRTLLIVWPDLDHSWPANTVTAFQGQVILYVGESRGGATGTDAFFDRLEDQFRKVGDYAIPQFWGLHDSLQVYRRRRPTRRVVRPRPPSRPVR